MIVVPFGSDEDVRANVHAVAGHLRAGGVIAYPTETVYGFGSALLPGALRTLAGLKRRTEQKPFLLLVTDAGMAPELQWTDSARRLAQAFWPGPLTLALRSPPGVYPRGVRAQDGTVAIRATPHPAVRMLLAELRAPITSTSANLPGEAPAFSGHAAAEVVAALDAEDAVWVLDGGVLPASAPSTVVDCSREPARVLREGALPLGELRRLVEDLDVS